MFDKLKVPTLGVVENMSYFECTTCQTRHYLFGQGARKKLVEQFGIKNSFEIPIDPDISHFSDNGKPFVLAKGESATTKIYAQIGESVVREISKLKYGALEKPKVSYAPGQGILVTLNDGKQRIVKPADLRRRCRCALCIEEFSGRRLLKAEDVSESVYPTNFQSMGNYAIAIQWSDGHTSSIYPYETIIEAAKETEKV